MKSALISMAALVAVLGALVVNGQELSSGALLQGVKTGQASYSIGESVDLVFVVRNRSDKPVDYRFSSSKQYDLWISQAGKEIYRHSKGKMYLTVITHLKLQPGETKEYRIEWNQKNNEGKQVGPGVYDVHAQLTPMGSQPPAVKTKLRIGGTDVAAVPVTVAEGLRRYNELQNRKVLIRAIYRGFQPNPDDPNTKDGPPVTRSDWAIADSTGCMYVNGGVSLDPHKDIGARVNVVGTLKKTPKGQVYMVLDSVTVEKPV